MNTYDIRVENLRLLMDMYFSGSQKECANALGQQPNVISMWLNKHRRISEESARAIERACGVFAGWMDKLYYEEFRHANLAVLASKVGGMSEVARRAQIEVTALNDLDGKAGSVTARKVETAFGLPLGTFDLEAPPELYGLSVRADSPEGQRDTKHDIAQKPLETKPSLCNVTPGPDIEGWVPLISWVRAGMWTEAVDIYEPGYAEEWLPFVKSSGQEDTYALRVEGDSMTAPYGRSFPEGSVIFVDPRRRSPANGACVVAKLAGHNEVTFKVFQDEGGRRWLKPLNPGHPPITDEFQILGTVTGLYMPV